MIPELSIVVPVYNEEQRIVNGISKILIFCERYIKKFQIIIVDDGSNDGTIYEIYKKIEDFKKRNIIIISYTPNKGKGYAIYEGMKEAKYKYILYCDVDLSTPLEELFQAFRYIRHYDVVLASRKLPDSKVTKQGFLRQLAGNAFPIFVNWLFDLGIKDTQTGFKLFNYYAATICFRPLKVKHFAFDVEILLRAKQAHYKIKEIGVTWINDRRSKVHTVRDSFNMFRDLLKLKWYYG